MPPWVSILLVSALATGYTAVGGIRAVVWTDTFQALVMVAGMIAVIIMVRVNPFTSTLFVFIKWLPHS